MLAGKQRHPIDSWQQKNSPWKGGITVVVNKYISAQLMKYLLALRSAGYCKIIFDGDASDYNTDAAIDYYTTADSLHLKIRVLDYMDMNGKITRDPDLLSMASRMKNLS